MKHVALCSEEVKDPFSWLPIEFANRVISLKYKYNLFIFSNAEKEMWKSQNLKKLSKSQILNVVEANAQKKQDSSFMPDWINPYTFDRYLMFICTCCFTWWSSVDWNKHSCVLSGSMSTISDKLKYSFKHVAAPGKRIKFDEATALDNNVDTIAHGR